jgi:hypothetical protein
MPSHVAGKKHRLEWKKQVPLDHRSSLATSPVSSPAGSAAAKVVPAPAFIAAKSPPTAGGKATAVEAPKKNHQPTITSFFAKT